MGGMFDNSREDWQEYIAGKPCVIHPEYKAKHPPTSKKPGCSCHLIWKFYGQGKSGITIV